MKILLVVLCMALGACAANLPMQGPVQPLVVQREPITRPAINLPPVDRLITQKVEWTIITPENIDKIFADQAATGQPAVLFALSTQGYENVAINTQEALRLILQQQAVIDGYRDYYIRVDRTIVKYNSNK